MLHSAGLLFVLYYIFSLNIDRVFLSAHVEPYWKVYTSTLSGKIETECE